MFHEIFRKTTKNTKDLKHPFAYLKIKMIFYLYHLIFLPYSHHTMILCCLNGNVLPPQNSHHFLVKIDAWKMIPFLLGPGPGLRTSGLTLQVSSSRDTTIRFWIFEVPFSESPGRLKADKNRGWFLQSSDHDMGVSKNRGAPKWMICNGKPY